MNLPKNNAFSASLMDGDRKLLTGIRLLTIGLVVLLPVASFAQVVSFGGATNFSVGDAPFSTAVGDLNGDGKLDLAVANHISDNVSILLGNGDGSFGAAANFAVGDDPRSVAIRDLNGDGKLDLAVANASSNTVSVLLGNGNGSFGAAANFAVGTAPFSVGISDLNRDGKLDLAVANGLSANVSILLGTGNGSFGTATNFGVGTNPRSVAIGDLNGDGKLDLAVANGIGDSVSILLGNGAGSFATATDSPFAVGDSPNSVAIGDLNGDGKLDLAVANFASANVSILLGTGNGSFGTATNFAVGTQPESVAIGDLNGDGKLDLAVANFASATVSVLLGTGNGSFGTATNFGVGPNPQSVATGDLNGDGKLDLAVASQTSDNASVILNTTSFTSAGSFSAATNFGVGNHPVFVAVGDLNEDGKLDLAVADEVSHTVSILLGDGTGSFAPATNSPFAVGDGPESVAIGDLNGDGKLDLAVANRFSNTVSIRFGDGTGSFGAATNFGVGTGPVSVAIADLNRDGRPDLAVANEGSDNASILLGTGGGDFGVATNFGVGDLPESVAVGDFNRDGKLDLAVVNALSDTVSVLLGDGTGSFAPATNSPFAVGDGPESVAIGDLNGDGKLDLAVANRFGNTVSILLGDGTGSFAPATNSPFAVGTDPFSVAISDLNRDGKLDLAVANLASDSVSILTGTGTGDFGAATNFAAGDGAISVAMGDLNRDGKLDLAVANENTDDVSILLNELAAPDLVGAITGPAIVCPGQVIGGLIRLSVTNNSSAAAGSFNVGVYLSSDATITTSDTLLIGGREFVPSLAGNTSAAVPLFSGASVPTGGIPTGSAFLGILVDEFNTVAEFNEINNGTAIPITITSTCVGGTTNTALSVPFIFAPASGGSLSGPQAVGDIGIAENFVSALSSTGRIELRLPPALTFATTPIVSTIVSNGLTLVLSGADKPRLEEGDERFSFAVASPSGPSGTGTILISGISVAVAPGFLPAAVPSGPVLVTLAGTNAGLTAASVQNATAVAEGGPPALAGLFPQGAAQGAFGQTVNLTGFNFTVPAAVFFSGAGITVTGTTVNNPTQVMATLNVAGAAAPGLRDVTVTTPDGSSTLAGGFRVVAPPVVTSTNRTGSNALPRNGSQERVIITGANFEDRTGALRGGSVLPGDVVLFSGLVSITVENVSYFSGTQIEAEVTVGSEGSGLQTSTLTVCNSFGACSTGATVEVADTGLPAPKNTSSGGSVPPAPVISGFSPSASGLLGSTVNINGSNFGTTITGNAVFFAGPGTIRVPAVVTAASSTQVTARVPSTVVDGPVTVAVGAQLSNGVNFTITNPRLSAVTPPSGVRPASGTVTVPVQLAGSKFATGGVVVAFSLPTTAPIGAVNGVSPAGTPTTSADGTLITLSVAIQDNAQLGQRNVTVTNPDGAFSTLLEAFEVKAPTRLELSLRDGPTDITSSYLPTVGPVSVTLNVDGECTAKMVTPVAVTLQAEFVSSTGASSPATGVTFTILTSSALAGTAINEDCPLGATKDFSFSSDFTQADAVQQVTVAAPTSPGVWTTMLYSYDPGGTATIEATLVADPTVKGSRQVPVDADRDGVPDEFESTDPALNPQDSGDPVTRDGLPNPAKFRGVVRKGPANGQEVVISPEDRLRLSAGKRHLFANGVGFGNDPQRPAGKCGVNPGAPAGTDPYLTDSGPCPNFEVGPAFQLASIGVEVHNATDSFTASTVFPTKSTAPRASPTDPIQPTLDLATVFYDGATCYGGEPCNPARTSKVGVRQWQFPTLGFSTFGSSTAYGVPRVFKQAVQAYINDRPYQHRDNGPDCTAHFGSGSHATQTPMLAPIGCVEDGNDNGVRDGGERVDAGGLLRGDTYISGDFGAGLSAMDINRDGCVELPLVADPTTIAQRCDDPVVFPLGALTPSAPSPQATLQQVVRSLVTHELLHALGVNIHTSFSNDIMYQYTINWIRDGGLSPTAAGLVQIHNMEMQ